MEKSIWKVLAEINFEELERVLQETKDRYAVVTLENLELASQIKSLTEELNKNERCSNELYNTIVKLKIQNEKLITSNKNQRILKEREIDTLIKERGDLLHQLENLKNKNVWNKTKNLLHNFCKHFTKKRK
jgi:hypothetical protein